jgi:hypothetical protein
MALFVYKRVEKAKWQSEGGGEEVRLHINVFLTFLKELVKKRETKNVSITLVWIC